MFAKISTVLFFEKGASIRVQVIVNFDLQRVMDLNVRIKGFN